MSGPQETPLVQRLPSTVPFVGPETLERQRSQVFGARLGANESVFGPSPKAIAAMEAAAPEAWKYCDPENYDLKVALAAHHGVAPENIVVGEGIDGLLGTVVRMFVAEGDAVVTSDGAYPTFNYHVAGFGGALTKVPYRDDKEDPDALIEAAQRTGARLIYLANPDNPMGSWHDAPVLERMIAAMPKNALLILDEAYVEFAPATAVPPIDVDDPRVLRMRTFSKAYGMAGLRVGYAIGEQGVVKAFDKVRNHFGVNALAQAAALAALEDQEWLEHVKKAVQASRAQIASIAEQNGLTPLPSATNFVTIDCGADDAFAKAVLAALIEANIFVRMPFAAPGNRCIRISCGTEADLNLFEKVLPKALSAARA